jgi:hypothetical protein
MFFTGMGGTCTMRPGTAFRQGKPSGWCGSGAFSEWEQIGLDDGRPLTADRHVLAQSRRRGRPKIGNGAKRLHVRIEISLLGKVDKQAMGRSRAHGAVNAFTSKAPANWAETGRCYRSNPRRTCSAALLVSASGAGQERCLIGQTLISLPDVVTTRYSWPTAAVMVLGAGSRKRTTR